MVVVKYPVSGCTYEMPAEASDSVICEVLRLDERSPGNNYKNQPTLLNSTDLTLSSTKKPGSFFTQVTFNLSSILSETVAFIQLF